MTTVTFLNGCILATADQSLWQYSYNQQLQISGLELPEVFTVDFCNDGDTTTIAMVGSGGIVDIPNELLLSGRGIVAYVFQKSALTGGITRCEIRIDVLTRPERDDETPTPEQEAVIDQLIAELNDGVDAAAESAEDAEAWAVGERDGEPVSEDDPTYENNAKYWAEKAKSDAPVTSVNGKSGDVELDLDDIPDGSTYARTTPAQVQQIGTNENDIEQLQTGKQNKIIASGILKGDGAGGVSSAAAGTDYATPQQVNAKYTKPSDGIPSTDMTAAVQTSLRKADTALQSAPVTSVNGQTGDVTIQPATDEQVTTAVNTWLGENVAQETGYVLDASLTMSNAAPPASAVGDLNIALTAAEKTAFLASKYGTSDLNILAMDNHSYTPDRTSNWQSGSYLLFNNLPITEGMTFHVGRFSGDCFGNQPCTIRFFDNTDTLISSNTVARTSLDAIGGFDAEYTAPEGTAYVNVAFVIISNASSHQLPTVGERYHMIWCYVYTGTGKLQVDYSMLTNQTKQFSLVLAGTATQAKLPNYDTVNKTLTVYNRTRLLSHDGTEISMLSEDLVLPSNAASQNNIFVYNTNTNTYALMRAGANLSGSPYIVLGEINRNNGLGNIQCGYTIDGYPVGSEKLLSDMGNLNLPTQWNDAVQTVQTAQETKFCFAIQTDTHFSSENSESSANNLKVLTQFVGFDFVANLGDVIRGYADETGDSPSAMRAAMTEIMHRYVAGISCPLMIAMGNHDTNKMWADAFGSNPFDLSEVWAREFRPAFNTNLKAVTKTGLMYYYTDFDDVRVIVLNTQDGGNGAFGIGQTQIDWLTNTALNTDKAVLVLSHVPLVDGWSVSSNYVSSYANAVTAIKAFQTNSGTVIGCMSGHTHTQESKTVDGILYVTFTNGADLCEVVQVDITNKAINTIPVGFTGAGNRSFTFV